MAIILTASVASGVAAQIWPVWTCTDPSCIINPFGLVTTTGEGFIFNEGIDISCTYGTDVNPVAYGLCTLVNNDPDLGPLFVRMHHQDDGYSTRYEHLSDVDAEIGTYYSTVDVIGQTGWDEFFVNMLHFQYHPPGRRINPLHILPYSDDNNPSIEGVFLERGGGNVLSISWTTTTTYYELDLNHMDMFLWRWSPEERWSDKQVDFDSRQNIEQVWNWDIDEVTQGQVNCFPSAHYPNQNQSISWLFSLYYYIPEPPPADRQFGLIVKDITPNTPIACPFCEETAPCWWGNPRCSSPAVYVASFTADLQDRAVLLRWRLNSNFPIAGTNIWKAERIDGDFQKITRAPIPAVENGDIYVFVDPEIEDQREYFYQLQLVFKDGTEIFIENLIASTGLMELLPVTTTLTGSYPNPFNNGAIISLAVGKEQRDQIRLSVFDALGRKVRCLTHGHFSPGNYFIMFDGLDDDGNELTSGIYFLTMQGGGQAETKKITLLR